MPDTNAPAPARPTLTQRRAMGPTPTAIPKLNPVDKPDTMPMQGNPAPLGTPTLGTPLRMTPIGGIRPAGTGGVPGAAGTANQEKGSPAKIVLWIVLIVAIAVASYFAIRKTMSDNSTPAGTPVPTTVTPSPTSSLIDQNVLADDQAQDPPLATAFNANSQTVGTVSTTTYSIDAVQGSKFDTFTRFVFSVTKLTGTDTATNPQVTAVYNAATKTIDLTFANTITAAGVMALNDQEPVNTSTVSMLTHAAATVATSDDYQVLLNQASTYVLHILSGDGIKVALDVKEVAAATTTPSVSVTPSGSVTATPIKTPTPTANTSGDILENDFSMNAQTLSNGLASNTADLVCNGKCFYWRSNPGDDPQGFLFEKPVTKGENNLYPGVSASLSGTVLTVKISNLVSRNATSPVTFTGSKLVSDMTATRSGNTLTWVFNLKVAKNYRIFYTTSDLGISGATAVDVLRVEVQP